MSLCYEANLKLSIDKLDYIPVFGFNYEEASVN